MKRILLEYLCCPECGGDLNVDSDSDEIESGTITCQKNSKHTFEIRGYIPRFVSFTSKADGKKEKTASNFAYQWTRFNSGYENDHVCFDQFLGPVSSEDFKGKVVLDAGCGMGRFANIASKYGAKIVIAIDLGESVVAAREYNKERPNVHTIQADIYNLPLKAKVELAYSLGVIHHLPNPQKAYNNIIRFVKDSGICVVWVYGKEGNEWVEKYISPVRTKITSRIPMAILYPFCVLIGFILFLILKLIYLPINLLSPKVALYLFYNNYFKHTMHETLKQNIQTVLDHLLPPFSFYISKEDLERWVSESTTSVEVFKISALRGYSWTLKTKISQKNLNI